MLKLILHQKSPSNSLLYFPALPVGHYNLMNLENLNIREEESNNYDLMLHIYPSKGMDYAVLTDEERRILKSVALHP